MTPTTPLTPPAELTPAPSPPPPKPPPFPTTLTGRWQRDWRLGTELVDDAMLAFTMEGVIIRGRRTNPLRGLLWLLVRLGWSVGAFAAVLSVVLTCIGLTWRSCVSASSGGCSGTWLWFGPMVALPSIWLTGVVVRWLLRRWLEPRVDELVPWDKVEQVATDGRGIDLVGEGRFGRFRARLDPKRRKQHQGMIAAISERRLPEGKGGDTERLIRSPWLDRAFGGFTLVAVCAGAVWLEPRLTAKAVGIEHPERAVPGELSARALDARMERECRGSTGDSTGVKAERAGADLRWTVEQGGDAQLALLRMKAGDPRFDLVKLESGRSGVFPGFFVGDHEAGIVVALDKGGGGEALLRLGRVEDLAAASCAGLFRDLALAIPDQTPSIPVSRDGDRFIVETNGLPEAGRILVVRRRASPRGSLFRWCEVPAEGDELHTTIIAGQPLHFDHFFQADADEGIALFVPLDGTEALQRLALGGPVQRCLAVESLVAGRLATHRGELRADGDHAELRWRTGARARGTRMFPPGADAAQTLGGIADRYAALRLLSAPGPTEGEAFDQAFFDAVDWSEVLDNVRFAGDSEEIDRLRRRVSTAGGPESGTYALLRLGEAFLTRFPVAADRYDARVRVGEAWLHTPDNLKLDGEGREAWSIVGRFVLADVGRRLEDDLNTGRIGWFESLQRLPLLYTLNENGIRLDVRPSSSRKALQAWVTGDFGYLFDRLLKTLAEKIGHQGQAASSRYALVRSTTIGGAHRLSALTQDGAEIGWVGLYDARKLKVSWSGDSRPPGEALLAMSAAYTDEDGRSSGVAIRAGAMQNWLWKPDLGGLVVVDEDGGVHLLDMRRGGSLFGRFLRPGASLVDFSTVLRTVQARHGSAFQTHLLAGGGVLRLNPDRASQQVRERRLLVLAHYRANTILCVVDLPAGGIRQGFTLHDAADIAKHALETPEAQGGPGLKVEAIANLDTGAKDFLVARDGKGGVARLKAPETVVPSNLLLFTPRAG